MGHIDGYMKVGLHFNALFFELSDIQIFALCIMKCDRALKAVPQVSSGPISTSIAFV